MCRGSLQTDRLSVAGKSYSYGADEAGQHCPQIPACLAIQAVQILVSMDIMHGHSRLRRPHVSSGQASTWFRPRSRAAAAFNPRSVLTREPVFVAAFVLTPPRNHESPRFTLISADIDLAYGAWVGARGIVCPGRKMGRNAVLSAGSVLTQDADEDGIYAGNPAVFLRQRVIADR